MTNDQMQSLRDDIAFMRALAQEGERTPMLGGPILMVAGMSFGAASLINWAGLSGRIALGRPELNWVWMGSLVVFFVGLFALKSSARCQAGAQSPVNRAARSVWTGAGIAMFCLGAAFVIVANLTRQWAVLSLYPNVVLAFYGACWLVGAAMTRKRWMAAVGAGCFLSVVGLAFLVGRPELYLAYAGCLMLFAAAPGFILMRGEPKDVV